MIEHHHLFDYFSGSDTIDYRSIHLAIFCNNDQGPAILHQEHSSHELSSSRFIKNFVVHSMIATTQGSTYRDMFLILPVANYPQYHALVVSIVHPGSKPIHERYFQIVLFVPSEVLSHLPNLIEVGKDFQAVVSRSWSPNRSGQDLVNLKMNLLYQIQKY